MMADQIAKTMQTMAENNKDVQMSLRLLIKYEIQSLLDRLSQLGEDSLLILGNSREESCSQLGTSNGEKFLHAVSQQQNLNLKEEFLKFCCGHGNNVAGNWNQMMPGGNVDRPMKTLLNPSGVPFHLNLVPNNNSRMQGQQQQQQQQQQQWQPARYTPYDKSQGHQDYKGVDSVSSSIPEHVRDRKKRNACRHFLNKGHCWQGSSCSFLHTRNPDIIGDGKTSQHTSRQDTAADTKAVCDVTMETTSSGSSNNT